MQSLHLLYHELRPEGSRYSYVTPCAEFEAHCALFARLQQDLSQRRLRPEITFDDGNLSDHRYAMPILERYGLRGHFFITAGWTGERAGFMDWSALRDLHAAGHNVGAHGLQHKLLTACSPEELQAELGDARRRLEDGLQKAVTTMSFPGGRHNVRVLRACFAEGYTQVFTSAPKAADMASRPTTIGRLNLVSGTGVEWLERLLDPSTGTLARLQRSDRVKTAAKTLLGDRFYARLWALANRQEPEAAEANTL